jgi:PKD repeat protein
VKIIETFTGKNVLFSSEKSKLRQIAGAPKAFWKNYWEFGDGDYSFEKEPKHTYKEKGNYQVRLSATNNYDDGKPPLTRPKKISINDSASNSVDDIQNENHQLIASYNGFRIQNNREPSPDEEMQLIVSYSNDKNYTTNGKLYVFFNEKKYKDKNFELLDIRSYHNEEEIEDNLTASVQRIASKDVFIRSTGIEHIVDKNHILKDTLRQDLFKSLEESKNYYHDYKVWHVNEVKENEERNLFFSFKTTPEMLKDTSAIITIRSIYVPERGKETHKITEKEMEIVTSHDPNKMAVYQTFLNYRLVRFKRLKYKVRFQNNGEGPASLIKLNVDIPKMLDKSTLKVIDMYPKVEICPKKQVRFSCLDTIILKDKISFQFKNIYLPGTNQKGVQEKDSTKGFVKYSMKFGKDFHKIKSKSRTEIIFDKNEPIITNSSTSRFLPGISIGAKAGYNYFFDTDENLDFNTVEGNADLSFDTTAKGVFLGATISPYKSYKWYLQAEIMASVQFINSKTFQQNSPPAAAFPIERIETEYYTQKNYLDIVPISVRYNFNSIIGAGFGPQFSVNGYQKSIIESRHRFFENINGEPGREFEDLGTYTCNKTYNKNIEFNNYGLFLDVTFGISRIGPSFGIRYIQNFNEPTNQIQTYAIWKF